ncbi:hypothetical protein [Pseudomonas reactans]
MAEMYLDDVRGYWRELASEAYTEFWSEYQSDQAVDRSRLMLIYRRLICAVLLLNHLADKAALMHRCGKGFDFINLVQSSDLELGKTLHACRLLSNDAKHEAKLLQVAGTRPRNPSYDLEGVNEVSEFNMLTEDGDVFDMCFAVGTFFHFWREYFDGSATVNFKQALSMIVLPEEK